MGDVSPPLSSKSISTFNRRELEALVSTAHDLGLKVAAHANTSDAIHNLVDVGIHSIEHGAEIYSSENQSVSLIQKIAAQKRMKWVPTLAAYYTTSRNSNKPGKSTWDRAKETFVKAVIDEGMDNIACGGDTGVFPHGENALELILMRRLGAPWEKVLAWATLGGWECIRGPEWDGEQGQKRTEALKVAPTSSFDDERGVPFGVVERGWAADIVGIEGDVSGTPEMFEKAVSKGVKVVIRGGKIFKKEV